MEFLIVIYFFYGGNLIFRWRRVGGLLIRVILKLYNLVIDGFVYKIGINFWYNGYRFFNVCYLNSLNLFFGIVSFFLV